MFLSFAIVIVKSSKSSCAAQKNTSNMAATIGDVMDDVTCKSSIGQLKN
jgi:hypothetical protein